MKKLFCSIFMILFAIALAGCERATIPPAAKGKIISTKGYSADIKETGRYWLFGSEEMVILDTSTQTIQERITVKMADDLDLTFNVRFRGRVHGNEKVINAMFNDIKHQDYQVTLGMIYAVYGRDVVQNVARSIMSKYKVTEISKNYDKINNDLQVALVNAMANSPLQVSNVTLADFAWPKVITDAIEKQQERELAIQTETNNQAVKLVEKENELALANKDYEVRIRRAETIRDENRLTAEGINDKLLQYRQLEVMEAMAKNNNAVFVPYESLTNVGLQNRMFK